MGLQPGEVHVVEDVGIDFSTERILAAPPFPEWSDTQVSRDRLHDLIESLRPQVKAEVDPRAMYTVTETEESGIQSHDPPQPLLDVSFLCCLLVTVGEVQPEEPPNSTVEEMVRDAMENVALRFVKRAVALDIRDRAHERGWHTTRLFSPGSGNVDWDVTHSAFVFGHLPGSEINVTLTESGLLQPAKSISSVIGLGPNLEQAPDLFTCEGCPRIPDCDYAVSEQSAASKP